ncbi:MAG: hypothetical protein HOP15_18480, partial [Planctomycetes bacterium]|nr:hypothetical protein [Planctomycetota bacterium]
MLLACAVAFFLLAPDDSAPVQWGERRLKMDELPSELPPAARAAGG